MTLTLFIAGLIVAGICVWNIASVSPDHAVQEPVWILGVTVGLAIAAAAAGVI